MASPGHESFSELLNVFLAHGEGVIAVIQAFLDESERKSDGTFSVAAYLYFPKEAIKLDKKWRKIMGGRPFHAKDFNTGYPGKNGIYSDLAMPVRQKIYEDLIGAVIAHAELAIAVSVNPRQVSAKWPEYNGLKTAYAVCCTQVVSAVPWCLDRLGVQSRVAYTFEAGHEHEAEAASFMNFVASDPERKERFRHLSHNFVAKEDAVLLETADLLAWEWSKCESETGFPVEKENKVRKRRRSMSRLLFSKPERVCVGHLDGEAIDGMFVEVNRIIQAVREGKFS